METKKICPNCRKPLPPDVPLGLCPECLIKSGFPTGTEPGATGEAAGLRFVPPPVEEIAQLFPQLEILGLIGKGGMGAVYKARQPALDRFVALKVLPPAVASDPGFAERFNREARALARLNHPNIVAVHDFGKAGPLHYLLMEFVDGTNLREVEHAGRLSPEQALAIVPQICEALQFAHNEGIVHRDIKPENLLLDTKGRVKITDFGIAKIIGVPAGKVSLTGVKDVVGTPHYMAPEQIEKPQTVDHRADIYSLGVVFYEMLTGELPLGKFQPPSSRMGGVQIDVRLDEVVLHTLEKEPARRYQQVSQVKTDVETIAGTVPPAAGFGAKGGPAPLLATPSGKATSDKAILPALLLAFPFGVFGAHRFYVGKIWTAFLQLAAWGGCILLIIACATLGGHGQPVTGILLGFLIFGCVVWAMIDWILILCKAFTDGQGRRITNWLHPQAGELKTAVSPLAGPPSTPPSGGTVPPAAAPQPVPMAHEKTPAKGTGRIVAPAVGLMVAGMLKLFSALTALFFLASPGASWLGKLLDDVGAGSLSHWGVLAGFSIVLLKVVPACLILFGGLQMLQLRSYAWAVAAGILAIVCCSLVGFPVGIWALIILARQDVRETFANAAVSPSPKTGKNWPWVLGTAAVAGVIVIGLIIAIVLALRPAGGNPNVNVRGTVTDAVTGKPIAGARMDDNRYGADADRAPQQAWTDKSGHYKLKTSSEEHTIAASAPGYETKLATLFLKTFGSKRELRMDFQLQPALANAPATNGGSGMASNISSQDGQAVIETTNGRLSADKAQLPVDTHGALNLTGRKIEPEPAIAPKQTAVAPAVQSEPHVQRTKIIGNLLTQDEFQQDFNQTLPLAANGRLALDNVNGRIEIVGWDRNEVAIKALKHGKTKESVEAAKITINSSPDEVFVHTEQPSSVTGFPWSWLWFKNSNRNDAVVDYAIQVPHNARLKNISSVNGRIVIDDVSGDIEASTVNGETQIQGAAGDLKLSTVNGRIEAELASLGGSQSVSLSTVNGHIEVTLPVNANAEVSASTVNGGMSSEFPALVVKKEFPVGSNLKGKLGNGGAQVKASAVNGRINFCKSTDAK